MTGQRPPTGHPPIGAAPGRAHVAPIVALVAALTLVAAVVASCTGGAAPDAGAAHSSTTAGVEPGDRTVAVVTTGCGSASATIGSAVRLDDTTVLTAAHVVAGAGAVALVDGEDLPPDRGWPHFSPVALFDRAVEATIVAFDPGRDLALLETDRPAAGPVLLRPEFGVAAAEETVEIHGAAVAATEGSVAQRTTIEVDAVRSPGRVERDGYRLDAPTTRGDSGAGVWSTDGRLVGVVFAVSSGDGSRSWAVSGLEITEFIDEAQDGPAPAFRCDDATSRVVGEP